MDRKNVLSEVEGVQTNGTTINSFQTKSISWSAIFAGTVSVLAILLVLNLIGVSIGLFSFDPASSDNPTKGLGTGSFVWWVITNIIALFLGGFVAGRVGAALTKCSAMIHGFMTWALYALVSVWLLTSAIGSVFSGLGSLVSGVAKETTHLTSTIVQNTGILPSADGLAGQINFDEIKSEAKQLLKDTEKKELNPNNLENKVENIADSAEDKVENAAKNPNNADSEIDSFFDKLGKEGGDAMEVADKDALVNILKNRTNMSEEEARQTVDNYATKYEKIKAEAKEKWENVKESTNETAENVTDKAGSISIWAALALIIGAVSAIFGGVFGLKNKVKDTTVVI